MIKDRLDQVVEDIHREQELKLLWEKLFNVLDYQKLQVSRFLMQNSVEARIRRAEYEAKMEVQQNNDKDQVELAV